MSKKVKEQPEKPKTKYDRKMEARRKAAEKEKRERLILRIVGIALLAAVICTTGYFGITRFLDVRTATTETYVSIGEHPLTQLEYDYYYHTSVSNYINSYSYFLAYMGLDTEQPLDEQQYSEDMTWQDYFEQMTSEQLRQQYALIDDAKANGFEYDTTEDYNTYLATAKETAKNANQTLAQYVKSSFGEYATVSNVKPFIEQSYYAHAYYDKLIEDYTPDDATVSAYYESHKAEYDKVSYYSFSFDPALYTDEADANEADTSTETADADEADTSAETADADETDTSTETAETNEADEASAVYKLANEMLERLKAGEAFEALCAEYATEDVKSNYESEDSEYSLTEDVVCSSTNSDFSEWLSDEARTAGDMTVIQSETTGVCYVLKFVSRTYDDTCLDSISSEISTEAVEDYIAALLDDAYEVTDLKGNLNYLTITEGDAEGSTDDTSADDSDSSSDN